ncbi:MAG: hypothetical protein AAFQ42_00795 [Pseudomonadota bacterium]
MIDYAKMLRALADRPPVTACERRAHASLLELTAACMRASEQLEQTASAEPSCGELPRKVRSEDGVIGQRRCGEALHGTPPGLSGLEQLRRQYAKTFEALANAHPR